MSAGGKIGAYLIYMVPYGSASTDFSKPGWGVGVRTVLPLSSFDRICALNIGCEVVGLASKTIDFTQGGIDYQQNTSQTYIRGLLGFQVGGYSEDFIRPYGGLNLAIVHYRIDDELIYPDNTRENLGGSGKTILGCDMTFGVDLNFDNVWNLDVGLRYVKSFQLPQQLGSSLVTVYPDYFQIYLGGGVSFDYIADLLPFKSHED